MAKINMRDVAERNDVARTFGWRAALNACISQIKRELAANPNQREVLQCELEAAQSQLRCVDEMDALTRAI